MKDPRDHPRTPLAHGHVSSYSPVATGGVSGVVIGGLQCRVGASVLPEGVSVTVALGEDDARPLTFPAVNVTRWCAETSVLIEVTLEAPVRDELRIRSPMLVGDCARVMALFREFANGTSSFVIAVASSPSALAREEYALSRRATSDEVRMLLTALESAAGATMTSRDART
jgi:hypothetical protein